MPTGVTVAALLVAALALGAAIVLARGRVRGAGGGLLQRLDGVQREQERHGRFLREEASRTRLEAAQQSRDLREEVAASVLGMNQALVESVGRLASAQQRELDLVVQRLDASSTTSTVPSGCTVSARSSRE